MRRKGIKHGFERIGMTLFVAVAVVLGAAYLTVGGAWTMPGPETEQGRTIAAAIAGKCDPKSPDLLLDFCHYKIIGPYRWRHFRDNVDVGLFAMILVPLAALAAWRFGPGVVRWIADGFKQE